MPGTFRRSHWWRSALSSSCSEVGVDDPVGRRFVKPRLMPGWLKMLVLDAEQRVPGREVEVGTLLELGRTRRHRQEAAGYTLVVVHLVLTHHVVLPVPAISTALLQSVVTKTADQPQLDAFFTSAGVYELLDYSY
jgi:hypothetical protein